MCVLFRGTLREFERVWGPPNLIPAWPNLAQLGSTWFQLGPKLAQVSPSWPELAPVWLQFGPTWPQLGPTWPQLGATWPQLGPTWPSNSRFLKVFEGHVGSQNRQKINIYRKRGKKWFFDSRRGENTKIEVPKDQKIMKNQSKIGSKVNTNLNITWKRQTIPLENHVGSILAPTWAALAPTWPNLAPTWVQLGPKLA